MFKLFYWMFDIVDGGRYCVFLLLIFHAMTANILKIRARCSTPNKERGSERENKNDIKELLR